MKKTTLIALLAGIAIQAQTFTTGEVSLASDYTAQIDVTSTDVTLTMVGPDDRWLGLGFGVSSMTTGGDIVSFDSSGFNDRRFIGVGATPPTDTQDWTVLSNDTAGGVRTLVATRDLTGSDDTDYEFDPNDTTILLVWARGNGTLTFSNHGQGNRGDTSAGFTLGLFEEVLKESLVIYPNPTTGISNVSFESNGEPATISIINMLGQEVKRVAVSNQDTSLDISSLNAGVYIFKIATENAIATKRIVKQ